MTKLSDKFPESALHVKIQSVSEEKKKGLAVLYVDARNVMDRLDEVVGNDKWSDEYHYIGSREVKDRGTTRIMRDVECRLTVNSTTKADTGEGEDMKTAYSDAFKRAGVKFGIARYLYSSDTRWFEVEKKGRNWYFVESDQKIIHQLLGAGTEKPKPAPPKGSKITPKERDKLTSYVKNGSLTAEQAMDILAEFGFNSSSDITQDKYSAVVARFEEETGSTPNDNEMSAYKDWESVIPTNEKARESFLDASRKRFFAFMKEQGMEGEDAKKYLKEGLGVDMSTNDILLDPELRRKLNIKVFNETGEVLFG